ncbi:hypothetical protein ACH49_07555 [Streptomyces leeuwenhoekii]|uniref:Tn3 transposase DDE domain-containing protein n=1 Tax=Streptomyces leeuwenhoekii TaxID=1437453 RepID=A0ABR5I2F2_STRLW|nr:Tn3 family transposase [Streptomyces leeuwenhoekii]KMS80598.1 hypothetical protein ACH49_07555 [Streptomyces leeuwenhoekii]
MSDRALSPRGFAYAPQLADLPEQKMWRIDRTADYGAFQDAARGRVDLARIERHWEDILRIIGSIHTGAVRAYDVIRMLSRDGRPTPLGDATCSAGTPSSFPTCPAACVRCETRTRPKRRESGAGGIHRRG